MPKYPVRPPRMQTARGCEQKNNHGSSQPRPLENGNWVCEDQRCNNVNYPRRTQCYRCGKRRGPKGDAIVGSYVKSQRTLAKLHMPVEDRFHTTPKIEEASYTLRCMFQPPVGPCPLHCRRVAALGSMPCDRKPFAGEWIDARQASSLHPNDFQSHATARANLCAQDGRSFRVATEGKHLAEQLLALFASVSSDPFKESTQCLEEATFWLLSIKSGVQGSKASAYFRTSPASCNVLPGICEIQSPCDGKSSNCTNEMQALRSEQYLSHVCSRFSELLRPLTWDDFSNNAEYIRELNRQKAIETAELNKSLQQRDTASLFHGSETCENNTSGESLENSMDAENEEFVRKYIDSLLEDSEEAGGVGFAVA